MKGDPTNAVIKVNGDTGEEFRPVCIKATELNKKTCNGPTNGGCGVPVGAGNQIVYGSIVEGVPKPGDAYDCMVTKNGGYTERFYYIRTEGEYTYLIYNKNSGSENCAYDPNSNSTSGPTSAYQLLPSKDEWNNPGIIAPGQRMLRKPSGNNVVLFDYGNKAARMITYQEITSIVGTSAGVSSSGYLDNYIWLMENISDFEGSGTRSNGYWLESPSNDAEFVNAGNRYVSRSASNNSYTRGVRPVIKVKTENIEQ